MIQFCITKDETECILVSDKHNRKHILHTNISTGKTMNDFAYRETKVTGSEVKIYCFDVHTKDNMIVFGGESNKTPFISVHSLLDRSLNVIGYISDDKLNEESHISFMRFPSLSRCIYNIRFLSKSTRHMVATDYNSSVVLVDMSSSNVLKFLTSTQIHRDIIQDICIHHASMVFTCSSDKTISKIQINTQ